MRRAAILCSVGLVCGWTACYRSPFRHCSDPGGCGKSLVCDEPSGYCVTPPDAGVGATTDGGSPLGADCSSDNECNSRVCCADGVCCSEVVDGGPLDAGPSPDAGCPGALTYCSGSCTDTGTDRVHCGTCQHTCSTTEGCSGAICTRYVPTADGTVIDYQTGLVWQRTASAQKFNWTSAFAHCSEIGHGGSPAWRLPTLDELKGIVDSSRINPSIDIDAFPGTPSDAFWSSTPHAVYPDTWWLVYFNEGSSDYNSLSKYAWWVRCVR